MAAVPDIGFDGAATARAAQTPDADFVDLARAVAKWRHILGEDSVVVGSDRRRYQANCIGVDRAPVSRSFPRVVVLVAHVANSTRPAASLFV